jgi:uncharacterized protein DUF5684
MLSTLALLFFQDAASPEIPAGAGAAMGAIGLVYVAILLIAIVAMWKIFTKAGKPGWAALIPIYNIIVLLEIAGKPAWWVILFLIPFVNFIMIILVSIAVAKNFGKGAGFGLGLAFLGFIFGPILAFGDAQYNPQP